MEGGEEHYLEILKKMLPALRWMDLIPLIRVSGWKIDMCLLFIKTTFENKFIHFDMHCLTRNKEIEFHLLTIKNSFPDTNYTQGEVGLCWQGGRKLATLDKFRLLKPFCVTSHLLISCLEYVLRLHMCISVWNYHWLTGLDLMYFSYGPCILQNITS